MSNVLSCELYSEVPGPLKSIFLKSTPAGTYPGVVADIGTTALGPNSVLKKSLPCIRHASIRNCCHLLALIDSCWANWTCWKFSKTTSVASFHPEKGTVSIFDHINRYPHRFNWPIVGKASFLCLFAEHNIKHCQFSLLMLVMNKNLLASENMNIFYSFVAYC